MSGKERLLSILLVGSQRRQHAACRLCKHEKLEYFNQKVDETLTPAKRYAATLLQSVLTSVDIDVLVPLTSLTIILTAPVTVIEDTV